VKQDSRDQLRIEIPEQGHSEVVIGQWSAEDQQFMPSLTITNDGKVIVHGDLVVENEPIIIGSTSTLSRFLSIERLISTPTPPGESEFIQLLLTSQPDVAITAVVEQFRANPEQLIAKLTGALKLNSINADNLKLLSANILNLLLPG
jgi:hypothetical protein